MLFGDRCSFYFALISDACLDLPVDFAVVSGLNNTFPYMQHLFRYFLLICEGKNSQRIRDTGCKNILQK